MRAFKLSRRRGSHRFRIGIEVKRIGFAAFQPNLSERTPQKLLSGFKGYFDCEPRFRTILGEIFNKDYSSSKFTIV